jgi:hypothetical protein
MHLGKCSFQNKGGRGGGVENRAHFFLHSALVAPKWYVVWESKGTVSMFLCCAECGTRRRDKHFSVGLSWGQWAQCSHAVICAEFIGGAETHQLVTLPLSTSGSSAGPVHSSNLPRETLLFSQAQHWTGFYTKHSNFAVMLALWPHHHCDCLYNFELTLVMKLYMNSSCIYWPFRVEGAEDEMGWEPSSH